MNDLDLTGRRVLVVEDEYLLARFLRELLEIWGATIFGPAATIEEALALLAQADRVDFAMLDVNLRGATAFAVADALRARGIPFIFTTGYTPSTIPERYRDAAVLRKPFSNAELARALLALAS